MYACTHIIGRADRYIDQNYGILRTHPQLPTLLQKVLCPQSNQQYEANQTKRELLEDWTQQSYTPVYNNKKNSQYLTYSFSSYNVDVTIVIHST